MAGQIFSERVSDITYQKILPTIVDQINNSNILLGRIFSKVMPWKGQYISQPIRVANSTTGGSFSGMDQFSTAMTSNTRQLTWYLAGYEQSVVISGIEKSVNAVSDAQAVSLIKDRLDEARISAQAAVGQILYGYGTGSDFDGLGLIVDNGSASANYGGLSRAANPYINADVTAVANGAVTLDYLSSEMDNVSAAGSATESPTFGITTKTGWSLIEGLIQPMVSARYETTGQSGWDRMGGGVPSETKGIETHAAGGFNSISYRARRVFADDMATTGTFFWLNENYLEFRRLKGADLNEVGSNVEVTEGFYKDVKLPSAWQFRDFLSPVAQYGEVGALILLGNFICRQPRRQGKLTGITGN